VQHLPLFDDVCMCGVEHADTTPVELEDQAFLRVDADAVACEPFSIIRQCDSLPQLRAQAAPRVDDLLAASLGHPEPMIQRREDSLGHGHAPAPRAAGQVETCSCCVQIRREAVQRLVAVDPYADDVDRAGRRSDGRRRGV